MMMQNGSLKHVGSPPSWIVEIEFLTSDALEIHVLCHRAKFCADRSYCCSDVAVFRVFLVKYKNSLDDRG